MVRPSPQKGFSPSRGPPDLLARLGPHSAEGRPDHITGQVAPGAWLGCHRLPAGPSITILASRSFRVLAKVLSWARMIAERCACIPAAPLSPLAGLT